MQRKIRFSIVGFGRIGKRHAEQISKAGELVSVCDINDSEKENIPNGVEWYGDIDSLLMESKTDVICVCTPNYLHAKHTIASFNSGFHVLCEKPMALSVFDCGEMIKASERANKRLFIVKQNRYNPPIKGLKNAIENNELGKILSVQLNCFWNRNEGYYKSDWKGVKEKDGGILYTQFSHFIDLLYWLIGDIKDAKSYADNITGRTDIEFDDTVVSVCKFYNGAIGSMNFTINSSKQNMEGSVTIFGSKATVKVGGQYLNELEYVSNELPSLTNLPKGNPANQYGEYQGSMSNHDKVYQNVVEVLNNNGIIATNGYEGLKTVEFIDKIQSSI